jgi:hypothetical protein
MAVRNLKDEYTLRVTDLRPLEEIIDREQRQGPRAPVLEFPGSPHESRKVDITRYDQVLEACRGMDAVINTSVLRQDPVLSFQVSMVGAYNVARAAACGVKRVIHTGPFHTQLHHNADFWNDFDVGEVPLHPGDDIYALTKYLRGHLVRVFAERSNLEVVTFLYCHFRPARVEEDEMGKGVGPFTVSWEDTGRAFPCGLRAPEMPSPYEEFLICAPLPHGKYRADKARLLLGWEARDLFPGLYSVPP